jgi:hypothetical protein
MMYICTLSAITVHEDNYITWNCVISIDKSNPETSGCGSNEPVLEDATRVHRA